MTGDNRRPPILVSACLLGRRCRFDGRDKLDPQLAAMLGGRPTLAVCPEELGGLGTPRRACQLAGGLGDEVLDRAARVIDSNGHDRSEAFVAGAETALREGLKAGVSAAILKDHSPSCGTGSVWREGALVPGRGVFAALLERHGITAVSETAAQSLLSPRARQGK